MNDIQIYNKPLTAAEIRANVNLIQEVMQAVMKKEIHYGTIPGTQKPTLFKAGSEKILSTFRIAVELDVEDLSTVDCYRYRVKARGVIPSGEIVGCGIGECSTDEDKYRWRGAINDKEWEATPEDRKRVKYIKPTSWNKDGEVRQIRTNPADLANTVLKMAKKRAQIDLTLTATAASDVFEQDLTDLPDEIRDELLKGEQPPKGKPEVNQPQRRTAPPAQDGHITDAQKKLLYARLKAADVSPDAFCAHYKIESITDLPFAEMNAALETIKNGEIKPPQEKEQPLPELCVECQQPIINGACRNPSCPEGRPEDE